MSKMTLVEKIKAAGSTVVSKQAAIGKTALTLEASRVLIDQLVKVASKKMPLMVRGYCDTPAGKAVIANLFLMGMEVALPEVGDNDVRKQVANAAVVNAYQEFLATFKAEEMLDEIFNSPALSKLTARIADAE